MAEASHGGEGVAYMCEYHIVAILDVLGQKKHLEQWRWLPHEGEDPGPFKEAVRQSVGVVQDLRRELQASVEGSRKVNVPDAVRNAYGPEHYAAYTDAVRPELRLQVFSDTVVLFAPIRNDGERLWMRDVLAVLGGTSLTMLSSLVRSIALRGAIEIGTGVMLSENEIYGPVLADAHELESKHAGYPRVLIGDNLRRRLLGPTGANEVSPVDETNSGLCGFASNLIAKNDEGRHILDYLGQGMRVLCANPGVHDAAKPLVRSANAFVQQEYDKYREKGVEKLAKRYGWLKNYFDTRVPDWNDTPTA